MCDARATFKESNWKTGSAQKIVSFVNENIGPDHCGRLALIACMANITVYDKQPLFGAGGTARSGTRHSISTATEALKFPSATRASLITRKSSARQRKLIVAAATRVAGVGAKSEWALRHSAGLAAGSA